MKVLSVILLAVAAVAFALTGCADNPNPVETAAVGEAGAGPLGKAEVGTSNYTEALDYYIPAIHFYPCLSEGMQITGTWHLSHTLVNDAGGGMRWQDHHNFQNVRGLTDSGLKYRMVEVSNSHQSAFQGPPARGVVRTAHFRMRLIGQGGAPNFWYDTDFHYTIDANDNVRVWFSDAVFRCQ